MLELSQLMRPGFGTTVVIASPQTIECVFRKPEPGPIHRTAAQNPRGPIYSRFHQHTTDDGLFREATFLMLKMSRKPRKNIKFNTLNIIRVLVSSKYFIEGN